jgi:hypothetical protein
MDADSTGVFSSGLSSSEVELRLSWTSDVLVDAIVSVAPTRKQAQEVATTRTACLSRRTSEIMWCEWVRPCRPVGGRGRARDRYRSRKSFLPAGTTCTYTDGTAHALRCAGAACATGHPSILCPASSSGAWRARLPVSCWSSSAGTMPSERSVVCAAQKLSVTVKNLSPTFALIGRLTKRTYPFKYSLPRVQASLAADWSPLAAAAAMSSMLR